MIEKIGKIKDTMLGIEDHGIMTFYLFFDFGGSCQGFGGYCLDTRVGKDSTASTGDLIQSVIKVCGVERWEDIKEKTMFALYEKDGYNQPIIGIKGLPFESNKTFLIKEWQEKWFPKEDIK